jgi:hypothetical protein
MENTEKQNLELITRMIQSARKEYNDDSSIYLLWGWTVTLACLVQYLLMRVNSNISGIVWLSLPVVAVVQVVMLSNQKKKDKVVTKIDNIIGQVWFADGICMTVVLVSMNILKENTYPVLMLLYGIGTYISGSIMDFRPMQYGAACCAVLSLAAFHVSFDYQCLLLPLSLILSYIIPGHLLRKRFKEMSAQKSEFSAQR